MYQTKITLSLLLVLLLSGCASAINQAEQASKKPLANPKIVNHAGFFDFRWDDAEAKVLLQVEDFETPFIYQSSLARGIGSNDIGLDRGQLGATRLVQFERSGNRVLLVQLNTGYVANSQNDAERRAVETSFARSVVWGFDVHAEGMQSVTIDITDFLMRDSHNLGQRLKSQDHGVFKVDASRSALYLPKTKSFPDNTEFEVTLTLTGTHKGNILRTVVPDPNSITVHTHHSFIRLPDEGYEPLAYDPRSGFLDSNYVGTFMDFATPINKPIKQSFVRRHRLKKQDPEAAVSLPVEPIVYYVDSGAPEPIRSALIEGAMWWNQAFEAAGFQDAFQVKVLPEDADPMDVRYNVIQWVHRSTRGWSYGSSVVDPRTGEILKGHVTLGSLRVRQDYMLAEGLLAPYGDNVKDSRMEAFSLARLRQLSAHEVGHTLGIEHNFAGSVNDRASVMDYPFPLIKLNSDGDIDISDAYGIGIGAWDKRVILWGYQDFPVGTDAQQAREKILRETHESGLLYVADVDARHVGTLNVDGNLWDNGADPVVELDHLMRVRAKVLKDFSIYNLPSGRPLSTLEEVLVPMYLLHRFQIQAAGKLIGGGRYRYNLKGDGQPLFSPIATEAQRTALSSLLATIKPEALALPEALLAQIPPRPPGYTKGKETFDRNTGRLFDPFGPAESAIKLTLDVLLEPTRGARLVANKSQDEGALGLTELLDRLSKVAWRNRQSGTYGEIQRRIDEQFVGRLGALVREPSVPDSTKSRVWRLLQSRYDTLTSQQAGNGIWRAHDGFMAVRIGRMLEDPMGLPPSAPKKAPPGSPIGAMQ